MKRFSGSPHVLVPLAIGTLGVALALEAPGVGLALAGGVIWFGAIFARIQSSSSDDDLAQPAEPVPQFGTGVITAPILIPVFDDQEPLEALVLLASLWGEAGSRIHVLRIEEVPCQAPFWKFSEHDAEFLARMMRASRHNPTCSFEGVLTHRREEVLRQRANDPGVHIVVMSWRPCSWRRIFDPLGRFISHPSCNLAVYRAATEASSGPSVANPRRILVVASRLPQDALLLQLALQIPSRPEGSAVTVCHPIPLSVASKALQNTRAYHESLVPAGSTVRAEVVRSTDPLDAVLQLSRGFDLLIVGQARDAGVLGWLRPGLEDCLIERASCAVVQLKAGLELLRAPPPHERRLSAALSLVEVVRDGSIKSRAALFRRIGQRFEEELSEPVSGASIEEALWEREIEESTAVSDGVATPHRSSICGLDRLHVGLWILDAPIEFGSTDPVAVDLCFVLIGPPAERPPQLRLLERVGQLAANAPLLSSLRAAESLEDARFALRLAEKNLPAS
ncbi:MAG: PTS sugar transporter subunit IIA [Planctomycetes bacterium]|nr:PTS sugar transporter subunit IIA [Planctomycetota bacterium]